MGRANRLLQPEDVHTARDMLASAKVVVCQLEIKPETALAGLKIARQMGGESGTGYVRVQS